MRIFFAAVFAVLACAAIAGCCSPSGCFYKTEQRATNLGNSVSNIALDGDGIN